VSKRPPAGLEELIGDGIPEGELGELRRVDALLRAVPPPPELPDRLATPAREEPRPVRLWTRRRTLAAVALAAALSAFFFGLGTRVGGGDDFAAQWSVDMQGTFESPRASALLRLGEPDADGNRPVRLEASGLEQLPPGGYYVLWLEKDGEYAGTCGTFGVAEGDAEGETEAEWTVSYDLADFDAWVVSARVPGDQADDAPRILEAEIEL